VLIIEIMRVLIHDFAGHPFQVQLSKSLAQKRYNVLHIYSKSIQTPKGILHQNKDVSEKLKIIGIYQKNTFPKYSPVKRWFSEKTYANNLIKITKIFRPEIVISGNTPLDIQKILLKFCKKKNIRFIFWAQDIYSAVLQQALKKRLPFIGNLFSLYYRNLEKSLLKSSDHVVVISDDFKKIIKKWINYTKITVIENWAPLEQIQPQSKRNYWSITNEISDKFCFLYAGTLGFKHNPEILIKLAKQYRNNNDIVIVIISEGIGEKWLKAEALKEKLNNVKFFNYLDFEHLPYALSSADVLIGILDSAAGKYCVPSKVLTYHCIGKPILLSVPSENLIAKIVKKQKSGFVIAPLDFDGFCRAAEKLKNQKNMRIQMGNNAIKYAKAAFNIDNKCNSFIKLFR
jgi:colanic acid biosynthesis glycosyl transferase WcaI